VVPRVSPSTRQQLSVVVALAVLVLSAGCSGVFDDEPELPDADEAVEQFSSVGVYNATLVTEQTIDNETTEATIEQTVQPATGKRYQVVVQNGTRTTTIVDNTTTWVYRPARNEATRIDGDTQQVSGQKENLRKLIDSLETDDDSGAPLVPIAPLFGTGSTTEDNPVTDMNFTGQPVRTRYQGVETVAGRDTHVIRMESAEDADDEMSQTLYYDVEYFVPLKAEYEMTAGGREIRGQRRIEQIDFSPAVDESVFEFDPPENVTVSTTRLDRFESYGELRRASDGHVPDPVVPESFEFDSGVRTEQGITLRYSEGATTIAVSRSSETDREVDGEPIESQGRTYTFTDRYRTNVLYWQCSENSYSVSGELDREALLDIAASIDCPASTGG
jgi:outer membrane lipoprotein-sorting protein